MKFSPVLVYGEEKKPIVVYYLDESKVLTGFGLLAFCLVCCCEEF